MLNKIGYIKEISFDALQNHLLSLDDRYEYYFAPKTQQYCYKAGISDDCLSAIAKEHQEYSRKVSRWVCTLDDFDELLCKQYASYVSDPEKEYAEWLPVFVKKELNGEFEKVSSEKKVDKNGKLGDKFIITK